MGASGDRDSSYLTSIKCSNSKRNDSFDSTAQPKNIFSHTKYNICSIKQLTMYIYKGSSKTRSNILIVKKIVRHNSKAQTKVSHDISKQQTEYL